MTILYHLQSLRFSYGTRTVLSIDELTLQRGMLYTLTGENGAGKSTLLRILAFLATPSSGSFSFAGEKVTWKSSSLSKLRQDVTLLQQRPYLFGGTVADNVAFGLKMRGVLEAERKKQVEIALDTVGLNGFQGRNSQELSSGEIQRVALARALALSPQVLLLDEPLANMDRETAELLDKVITSLPAKGISVIMSTHDPSQSLRNSGEVIHLVAGKLAEATS